MLSAPQIVSAAVVCTALALPAQAQTLQCGPRGEVLEMFAKEYSEIPVAVGLARSGDVIEILSSAGGRTWSMFINRAEDGLMCILGDGQGWQAIKAKEKTGEQS